MAAEHLGPALLLSCHARAADDPAYLDPGRPLEARVADLTQAGEAGKTVDLDALVAVHDRLVALRRKALLANPLLRDMPLLLVKRSERSPRLGLPQNWQGNCALPRHGYNDEIAVLSRVPVDMPAAVVPSEQAVAALRSLPAGVAPDRAEAHWARALRRLPPGSLGYVNLIGLVLIAPLTVLTAPLGARLAHRLGQRQLSLAFGVFLLLVAARMLYRTFTA